MRFLVPDSDTESSAAYPRLINWMQIMNRFQMIIVATVIAIPGVTFAQSDASTLHVDTSADLRSRSVGEIDYPAVRQPTESTVHNEKQSGEQRNDVVLSPYSPPIHVVKQW